MIGVHYMVGKIFLDLTHSDEPLKGMNKKEIEALPGEKDKFGRI